MYDLYDSGGSFVCRIDTESEYRTIILRDRSDSRIGYGEEKLNILHANSICLFLDNGIQIGVLDRELGLDGRPDCVVFSGPGGTRSIPVSELGCPYITEVLFGDYAKNIPVPEEKEPIGKTPTQTGGTGSVQAAGTTVLSLILFAAAIVAFIFLKRTAQEHTSVVSLIFGTIIPILFGLILLLICLLHRNAGARIRIAGLIESAATVLVTGFFLRLPLPNGTDFGDDLYHKGEELLNCTTGFRSVLYGLGFIAVMFLLYFLVFVLLAVVYRTAASIVKDSERKQWLKGLDLRYHRITIIICSALFLCGLMLFNDGGIFISILLGVFAGAFVLLISALVHKLSQRILQ